MSESKSEITKLIEDIVKKHGKSYVLALLPDDLERGKIGDCFEHCLFSAFLSQRVNNKRAYYYVEGIAGCEAIGFAHHAWLTDGNHAYDPTWYVICDDSGKRVDISMFSYFGIELGAVDTLRFFKETGYKGFLNNRERAPEMFDRILNKYHAKNNTTRTN